MFAFLLLPFGLCEIDILSTGSIRDQVKFEDICKIKIPKIKDINENLFLSKINKVKNRMNDFKDKIYTEKNELIKLQRNILKN